MQDWTGAGRSQASPSGEVFATTDSGPWLFGERGVAVIRTRLRLGGESAGKHRGSDFTETRQPPPLPCWGPGPAAL